MLIVDIGEIDDDINIRRFPSCEFFFFFFQAEDGIRDTSVTGVQTCALPISTTKSASAPDRRALTRRPARSSVERCASSASTSSSMPLGGETDDTATTLVWRERSEERRVGKECRSRWKPDRSKKRQ